jgi:hypothetical protein
MGASSERLGFTACAITGLTVENISFDDLHDLFNSYVNTLAISPQAR